MAGPDISQFLKSNLAPLLFLVAVFLICTFPIQEGDIFIYLAMGREFFRTSQFPQTDIFIHSLQNHPWHILHEWGAFALSYMIYVVGGYTALILIKASAVTFLFAAGFWFSRVLSLNSLVFVLFAGLAIKASLFRLFERSSLYTDIVSAIILALILLENRRPSRFFKFIPLLFLVWVNIHPGFPIGLFLLGVFILVNFLTGNLVPIKNHLKTLALSTLACLANPRGIYGALFPFDFFNSNGDFLAANIYEFMSTLNPLFRTRWEVYTLIIQYLICLGLLIANKKSKPWFEVIVLVFFVYLGLAHFRSVTTAAFSMMILNIGLASHLEIFRRQAGLIWASPFLVALLFMLIKIPLSGYTYGGDLTRKMGFGLDQRIFTSESVQAFEALPTTANVFNSFSLGCYLPWMWDGKRKVVYDCNDDAPELYMDTYGKVALSQDHLSYVVNKYNIGFFIISLTPSELPLIYLLHDRPEWKLHFHDGATALFVRKDLLKDY